MRKHTHMAYSPFPPEFWRQNIVDGVDDGSLTCKTMGDAGQEGCQCEEKETYAHGVLTLSSWILASERCRMLVRKDVSVRKHTRMACSPFPPGFWRQNVVDGVDGGLLTCKRWTVGTAISQQRSPLEPSPLPKGVNQVVNRGSRVVNRTWQSCESPFPPAREL